MTETVINQSVLGFFAACALALPLGLLVGWRWRFEAGVAAGCLLIGLAGCAAAAWLGWYQWQWSRGSIAVEGVVVVPAGEMPSDGRGSSGALVRLQLPDGTTHDIRGLDGGLRGVEAGERVSLRYLPGAPEHARIDDFQHLWGGVWGMSLFGLLPLSFGLFFAHAAWAAARPHTALPSTPLPATSASRLSTSAGERRKAEVRLRAERRRRRRVAARLLQASMATMVLSLILGALWPGVEALTSIGYAFLGIVAGLAMLLASVVIGWTPGVNPSGRTQTILILMVLMIGFGMFGMGALLLGG